jgi:hypothetical protein
MAVRTLQMSISHAEFFRQLVPAVAGMRLERTPHGLRASAGVCVVLITLSEEHRFRIGSLELPSTKVTLEGAGFGIQEWEAFLARFDRAFQRGGG